MLWLKSSLVKTPQNTKKCHCGIYQQKNITFRTSLTGLGVLLRNAIVIISLEVSFSRQASGGLGISVV